MPATFHRIPEVGNAHFPSPPSYPSQRSAVMANNTVVTPQPLAGTGGPQHAMGDDVDIFCRTLAVSLSMNNFRILSTASFDDSS